MEQIKFGTDGWRATLDIFTAERVNLVGEAIVSYVRSVGLEKKPIIIVHDARESSPIFVKGLYEKMTQLGQDVICGDRDYPTPMAAWTVVDRDLAGAIVITASHNPPEYNGIKFIPAGGAPALPEVTTELEKYLMNPNSVLKGGGKVEVEDFMGPNVKHVNELVGTDLKGLEVVYDAMHGSGRGITDEILRGSGADVKSIRDYLDPTFGGTPPEPKSENLELLVESIQSGEGDIGIANDGDADRVAVVTPRRGCLDGNLLFAVLYEYLLERDTGPAVRTVSTTYLIDKIAESHDQSVVEVPVGFKWVAQAMKTHSALFGGEDSGGFSMKGHVREKDGILIAQLAASAELEMPLDERVDLILERHGEVHNLTQNIVCQESKKKEVLDKIHQGVGDEFSGVKIKQINAIDGVKILLVDGSWILLRPSGTEPKMRIYTEGNSKNGVEELVKSGEELISGLIGS